MKKLLVLSLAIILIFTITGCNKKKEVKRVYTYERMYRQELNKEKTETSYVEDYKELEQSVFVGLDLDENNIVVKIIACGVYHKGKEDEKFFCIDSPDKFETVINQLSSNIDFNNPDRDYPEVMGDWMAYNYDTYIYLGIVGDVAPQEDCHYEIENNKIISASCDGK